MSTAIYKKATALDVEPVTNARPSARQAISHREALLMGPSRSPLARIEAVKDFFQRANTPDPRRMTRAERRRHDRLG